MWNTVFVVLFLVSVSQGALNGDYEKINNYMLRNGTNYYALTSTANRTDSFGLFYGKSLGNYNGYIIAVDATNEPDWLKKNSYQDGDLNVIEVFGQATVRIYFAAKNKKTKKLDISAIYNPTLFSFGRYQTIDYQLIYNSTYDNWSPSLSTYNGQNVLSYIHNRRQDITDIGVAILDTTAMEVVDYIERRGTKSAVQPDQWWEGKQLKNQWAIQRGDFLYIFYETEIEGFVGVARSSHLSGPFEKIAAPLYSKEKAFMTREHVQKNLAWDNNGWPYIQV